MEQVLDWLNENELRAYPLLDSVSKLLTIDTQSWELPNNFLLDLQLTFPSNVLTNDLGEEVPVILKKIELDDNKAVKLVFSADTYELEFNVPAVVAQTYPLYVRTPSGNLAVFGLGLADFAETFSSPLSVFANIPVEPATCSEFFGPWLGVNSIKVSPEKVSANSLLVGSLRSYEPLLPLENAISQTILQGDIKFMEGYNFRVAVKESLIDLEISTNYGLKMNCTTSFIPEEYLDCASIVSYINGIPPDETGTFRIAAGSNISITKGDSISSSFYDPLSVPSNTETSNAHTLFVGLNFQSTDVCAPVNLLPNN